MGSNTINIEARFWVGITIAVVMCVWSITDDWRSASLEEQRWHMSLAYMTSAKVECAKYGIELGEVPQ